MEFWRVILGLIRRKLLILPLLAAAVTLGIAGYFLTPLKYISSTTMVLAVPAFGGTLSKDPAHPTNLTNPMLNFSDDLKTASAILIHAMNTPEVAKELGVVKGGPTKLTIDDGTTSPDMILNNGPFVYIAGESTSRTEAKDVVIRAQKRMRQELIDRQKSFGAPPETYVALDDVVSPSTPKVTRADNIKVGGIAFAMCFAFGLSGAYAWRASRHGRKSKEYATELSGEHLDNNLASSRDSSGHDHLDVAAQRRSGDLQGERADRYLTDGDQHVEQGKHHVDNQVAAVPQPAAEMQMADGEQEEMAAKHAADEEETASYEQTTAEEQATAEEQVTEEERATAEEQAAADQQVAEPRQVTGPLDEESLDAWDLYIVRYPPANGVPAPGPEDDELDWSWDWGLDIESERNSAAVGAERSG